jgi:hypothetical protein
MPNQRAQATIHLTKATRLTRQIRYKWGNEQASKQDLPVFV